MYHYSPPFPSPNSWPVLLLHSYCSLILHMYHMLISSFPTTTSHVPTSFLLTLPPLPPTSLLPFFPPFPPPSMWLTSLHRDVGSHPLLPLGKWKILQYLSGFTCTHTHTHTHTHSPSLKGVADDCRGNCDPITSSCLHDWRKLFIFRMYPFKAGRLVKYPDQSETRYYMQIHMH